MTPIQSKTVRKDKLSQPGSLREGNPISGAAKKRIAKDRKAIKDILSGKDKRKLAIVGPCSMDETDAVHEFVTRIKPIAEEVADDVFVVVRAPIAKPRTVVGCEVSNRILSKKLVISWCELLRRCR